MTSSRPKNEAYYREWIDTIADSDNVDDIEAHIVKHALELTAHPNRNKVSWAVSMQNLIDIYVAKYDLAITPETQIFKLFNHYKNNPDSRTPPPGGAIPHDVVVQKIPKFD